MEDREHWSQRAYTFSWMQYTFCLSELRQATDTMAPRNPEVVFPRRDAPTPPSMHTKQAYLRATWETNLARINHSLIEDNTGPEENKLDVLLSLLEKRVAKETIWGTCDAIAINSISWEGVDDEVVARAFAR